MSAKVRETNSQKYRITKVYTKTGDQGTTGLVGGQRVSKAHIRIESYGTVDELSAILGEVRIRLNDEKPEFHNPADAELLSWHLEHIQHSLFVLGGDLATETEDRHPMMPTINLGHVEYMESVCDKFNECLPPLKDFILAGGSKTATALHHARTVCRRAERCVTSLSDLEEINETTLIYLNRLSDALFVLGRWVNFKMNQKEFIWRRNLIQPPFPQPDKPEK